MKQRVILITGTSRGIGEALAKHYLELGDIVVGCSRSIPEWSEKSIYPQYHHFCANVSDEDDIKRIFSFFRRELGGLDCLINNAGIASMNHSLLTPISALRSVIDTNMVGTFLFCREAAKVMKKKKYGRIVNFSTVAVPLKLAGEAVYAASKAAIVSLTQVLAKEYADFGITVNAVGPVPIRTALIKGVSEEKLQALLSQQAIHRFGTFEDVENIIDFYFRPESDFVTGQVLYLGGV